VSPIRSAPRGGERSRRGRRWLPRTAGLTALTIFTAGCQATDLPRLGFLTPATKQGQMVLSLWQGSWLAALLVGIFVWGAIIWAVVFYRKRSDKVPPQVRYNLPIEMLYTVLPFIMVGVLFYFTARDENSIDKLSARPDVRVSVTGWQWSWQFQYPQYGLKAVKGAQNVVTETGDQWKPNVPYNQQHFPLLEIPVNETVRFDLTSIDVIHAFWIVPFEFKRDVIPNHPNHFEVTPVKTGTWTGRCTELCGLYHSRMLFTVKIVTPAQFQQWIKSQQAQQNATGGAQ